MTGQAGYLPKNFVTQMAETNTWTVHVALPLCGREISSSIPSSTSTGELCRGKYFSSNLSLFTLLLKILPQFFGGKNDDIFYEFSLSPFGEGFLVT